MTNEQTPLEIVAAEVRAARRELRMSQHDLAYASKVPRSTIASMELAVHRPQSEALRKIATALGVDVYRWERILDGRPADLDLGAVDLASLLDGKSPEIRRIVRDWLQLPHDRQEVFAAAVSAMLAAMRPER